jgi:spore germination protein KB
MGVRKAQTDGSKNDNNCYGIACFRLPLRCHTDCIPLFANAQSVAAGSLSAPLAHDLEGIAAMERIPHSQLIMLLVIFEFTATISFVLGPLAAVSNYDAWIALIAAGIIGWGFAWISYKLSVRRPQQFFVQYGSQIVGRWLHIPLCLLLVFYFLHSASIILREFGDFMVTEYYQQTPVWAVAAVIGLCVACAVRIGFEGIFRCAQGFFFIILGSIFIVPFFINKEMNFAMMSALVKHRELPEILRGAYLASPMYGAIFVILVFFPWIKNGKKTMRSLGFATAVAIFCVLIHLVPAMMIFSPKLVGDLTYPDLELMRYIRVGDFLENLDPVLVASWSSGIFLTISLFLFCAVFSLSQLLKMPDYKPLSFAVTAIVVTLSITMARSSTEVTLYMKHAGMPIAYICQFAIPLLYLAVDTVRGKFINPTK